MGVGGMIDSVTIPEWNWRSELFQNVVGQRGRDGSFCGGIHASSSGNSKVRGRRRRRETATCGQGQRRSSQQRAQRARQLKRGRKEGPEGMTCWSVVSRSLTCGAGNAVLQMQRSLGRIID
ncbi:unnamed protein product [Sphagnum compactum]